jgi:hypothetical protein
LTQDPEIAHMTETNLSTCLFPFVCVGSQKK